MSSSEWKSNSTQAIVRKVAIVDGVSLWFVARTGPIASSVNAPRQPIRVIKPGSQNRSRMDIYCRKYVSVFLYRHEDPVACIRLISCFKTDTQMTG